MRLHHHEPVVPGEVDEIGQEKKLVKPTSQRGRGSSSWSRTPYSFTVYNRCTWLDQPSQRTQRCRILQGKLGFDRWAPDLRCANTNCALRQRWQMAFGVTRNKLQAICDASVRRNLNGTSKTVRFQINAKASQMIIRLKQSNEKRRPTTSNVNNGSMCV